MIEAENIFNRQFLFLYFLSLFFITFFLIEDIRKNRPSYNKPKVIIIGVLCIIFLLLFGTRDFEVGVDNKIYLYIFGSRYATYKDFGFKYYTETLKAITDARTYLFITAIIYISFFFLFIKKWNKELIIYLFFMYISLFFFKNMGMNIIRQGVANILVLYGIALYKDRKIFIGIIFFVLGFSFQASVLFPILAWFLCRYISLKACVIILIISSILSILGFGLEKVGGFLPFLSGYFDNRFDSYIDKSISSDYVLGFRVNFFVFNWIFILIGLWIRKKIYNDELQDKILKTFILLSVIFFLYFNLPYSDRIGLLSWMFIPLIVLPVFRKENMNFTYKILAYFLFFFIFIIFVIFPSK